MYYIYKKVYPSRLILSIIKCCSKSINEKIEESLKQIQSMNSIEVKQYQYSVSIEYVLSEGTKEPSERTIDLHSTDNVNLIRSCPRSKKL